MLIKVQIKGLWLSESSVEVILALNRCLFFLSPKIAFWLFGDNEHGTAQRTWLWMVPPTLWGSWYMLKGTSPIFSSIIHTETYNPHHGYFDDMAENVSYYIV